MRVVWILLICLAGPALACGADSRCPVPGGYYLAVEPPDWDGRAPLPVVVYFHGWNGAPEGTMRNRALVNGVTRRGALLVLPYARTGYWRQIGRGRHEGGRDEATYIRAVMADVARRWPVDAARTLASGFSRGSSMVWNVACYAGDLFAAYAPIAGGFWHSTPADCPSGPVHLRHIHGEADRVVAFDTVGVYNSRPIPEGLTLLRQINRAGAARPVASGDDRLRCERWDDSGSGKALELCLHPRGHSIPAEWVAAGFDWMLEVTGARP